MYIYINSKKWKWKIKHKNTKMHHVFLEINGICHVVSFARIQHVTCFRIRDFTTFTCLQFSWIHEILLSSRMRRRLDESLWMLRAMPCAVVRSSHPRPNPCSLRFVDQVRFCQSTVYDWNQCCLFKISIRFAPRRLRSRRPFADDFHRGSETSSMGPRKCRRLAGTRFGHILYRRI